MAAPIAKRSCERAGARASAASSAAACGSGSCPSNPSAGRISSNSDANGISASDSIPRARSSCIGRRAMLQSSAAASSSAVFPIPGSPTSATVELSPTRACASASSISAPLRIAPEKHGPILALGPQVGD